MVVTISGGVTSGNPNNEAELLALMSNLNQIISSLNSTRTIHFSTSQPDGATQEGDLWYNPDIDRFHVYIET